MPRRWSPLKTIGYEIKVSRQDFLNDDKWHEYLGFVNELWFACPWELIKPDEIPPGVGLLWMNAGGRLVRKKKAVRQKMTAEMKMPMAYILMSRANIVPPRVFGTNPDPEPTEDDWRQWLAGAETNRPIMRLIEDELERRVQSVYDENADLKRQISRVEAVKEKLRSLGIDPNISVWSIEDRIEELRSVVPKSQIRSIHRAADEMKRMADDLEKMRRDND
jgi:hypothetical protein